MEAMQKRAKLVISRVQWSNLDLTESAPTPQTEAQATGSSRKDSVRQWLTSTVTEEDAKPGLPSEHAGPCHEPLRRNPSSEDDLALGVEASLYGKQGVRTVQEFLRSSQASPSLTRWNSFNSTASAHSGPLSVMDVLNLWNDDPEEVLLDLGFGCDEPDLSGRIPARFINNKSQARGINIQVFLEAQKSRLDLENPDVSNRFRQLEVLQQVTTAFSSIVGASGAGSLRAAPQDLPADVREKRRRMGMLLRRASKKSLSQLERDAGQLAPTPASIGDKKVSLKRSRSNLQDGICLSPLAEEQGTSPDLNPQPQVACVAAQDGTVWLQPVKEGTPVQRKRSPGQARESFEMEEIQSFDEGSFSGSYTGVAENPVRGIMRTNSCQSDSSGFLEEPFIPTLSHQIPSGPELTKALLGMSGSSTDSQITVQEASSPLPSPTSGLSQSSSYLSPSPDSLTLSLTQAPATSETASIRPFPPQPSSPPPTSTSSAPPPQHDSPQERQEEVGVSMETSVQERPDDSPPSSVSDLPPPPSRCSLSSVPIVHGSQSPLLESPASSAVLREEILVEDGKENMGPCFSLSSSSSPLAGRAGSSPTSPSLPYASWLPVSVPAPSDQTSPPSSCPPSSSPKPASIGSPEEQPGKEVADLTPSDPRCSWLHMEDEPRTKAEEARLKLTSPICKGSRFSSFPSARSCELDAVTDLVVRNVPETTKDSAGQSYSVCIDSPGRCHNDDNTDCIPDVSPSQDAIRAETDHLTVNPEDRPPGERGEVREVHIDTDNIQTSEGNVHNPNTECSAFLRDGSRTVTQEVCEDTKTEPQVCPCVLHERFPGNTKQKPSKKFIPHVSEGTECEHEIPKPNGTPKLESKVSGPIEIESLDDVFETSVDVSVVDGEFEDVETVCRELDSDGYVYWAEPIDVSSPSPLLETSGSLDASVSPLGNALSIDRTAMDLPSSEGKETSSLKPDFQRFSSSNTDSTQSMSSTNPTLVNPIRPDSIKSKRSVSIQMPSFPSVHSVSHIVSRKDVPYMTQSNHAPLLDVFALDTSTPLQAVRSWTDLQLRRNALAWNKSYGGPQTFGNQETTAVLGATEMPQRSAGIFSSTPSFPTASNGWNSRDIFPRSAGCFQRRSVSLDTGLWPDEENGAGYEEAQWVGPPHNSTGCCCSCDHHCSCCTHNSHNRQLTSNNCSYSLEELQGMMRCIRQYLSVLTDIEKHVSDDQAVVFSTLSDAVREEFHDIVELRRAAKHEAGELELQLQELTKHYDDGFKMKMHRLLDEQSSLCSRLRLLPPKATPTLQMPVSTKNVATQCCMLPWLPLADSPKEHLFSQDTWDMDSPRRSLSGLEGASHGSSCSPTKSDKLDFVGFIQRLKESLRHSVNTDSLE